MRKLCCPKFAQPNLLLPHDKLACAQPLLFILGTPLIFAPSCARESEAFIPSTNLLAHCHAIMGPSLLVPWAVLAFEAFALHSHFEISRRDEYVAELESWLATAQRASLDTRKRCPVPCSATKDNSSSAEWFLFPDAADLASCNETMLLNMAVKTTVEDQITPTAIRACIADYGSGVKAAFVADGSKASLCSTSNRVLREAPIYMHEPQVSSNGAEFSVNHLLAAGHQISRYLAIQVPSCAHNAIEFAYSQSAAIGVFTGAEIHQHGVT